MIARRQHVDKVDHDQTAHVAQAQLTGNLVGRFEVGAQRRILNIGGLGGARRVDVNGDQRLGRIDDNRAAGRQADFALKCGLDLTLDLEAVEQGDAVFVAADTRFVPGHDPAHEVRGLLVRLRRVDQNLIHIVAQIVAHRADDDVALLVKQHG